MKLIYCPSKYYMFVISILLIFFTTGNLDAKNANQNIHHTKAKIKSTKNISPIPWDLLKKAIKMGFNNAFNSYGEYNVEGKNTSSPLVLFNRPSFEKDKLEIISNIKDTTSEIYDIYLQVYKNVVVKNPSNNQLTYPIPTYNYGSYKEVNSKAAFAKNAAFLLVLNVKENGVDVFTSAERELLKNNVMEVLENAYSTTPEDYFSYGDWGDGQFYRSQELMNYLIALDLLRTAGYSPTENATESLKMFTKRLYIRADRPLNTLSKFLNNNLTEITSATLVMAAIVMSQEQGSLFNWRAHPKTWAKKGHCRLRETEFTGIIHSQSQKSGIYGHEEGPGYYSDAMKYAIIPMTIAFDNFVGNNMDYFKYMSEGHLNPLSLIVGLIFQEQEIRNYLYETDWRNTADWYCDILQPNGFAPSIDDTRISAALPTIAAFKDKKYSLLSGNSLINALNNESYNDKADFLALNKKADYSSISKEWNFVNRRSGDAVFRTPMLTKENDQHYLHITGFNPTFGAEEMILANFGRWEHSHPSAGNIIINAGNEILLLDPAYYGYSSRHNVNMGNMHNVVTVDGQGPVRSDDPKFGKSNLYKSGKYVEMKTIYRDSKPNASIKRKIYIHEYKESKNGPVRYYYEMIDDCRVKPTFGFNMQGETFTLNLNGNGISGASCDISMLNTGQIVWKHPCNERGTWKLYARTTSSTPNINLAYSIFNDNVHGNDEFKQSYFKSGSNLKNIACNSGTYTNHTRFKATFYAEKGTFHTILWPLRCDEVDYGPDSLRVKNKNDSTYTLNTLYNIGEDTCTNLHFASGASENDTINIANSMFLNDTSQKSNIKFKAEHGFLSFSKNNIFKMGNCIALTRFRIATVGMGNYLSMNDTVYIKSTKQADIDFEIIAPSRYSANINTDTACTISFFLAGMERGVGMKVEGLNFTYDTGTCIISIEVPIGLTQFEIELEDPCRVSCFFPSTAETIDGQFDFSEGITQTLGHKLSIVKPNGFLNITNGSHMMLCDGIYLHNRDSLVLYSGCGKDTGQVSISTCNGAVNGTPFGAMSGAGGGAKSSMLSVKAGAALILEDSSFTQISNNSELHVWGTLVIKKGAKLLIGDGRTCAYATIMVYPGANLHIEDDAHLEFFKIIGDTQDRHIFFIANKPYGASVQKGVASNILTLLQNDTIINNTNIPVEICDLYTVTPTHGIANRDYGFSNVLAPKALIKIPNDTICEDECLMIDFKSSLNDPIREIEVCRIDTFLGNASLSCFGSWRIEGNSLEAGYNENTKCYSSQTQLSYFPLCDYIDSTNHWYKIFVKVKNHCDLQDTQTIYFYIAHKPNAIIAVADSACPGYETVKAYNLSNFNAEKAIWHVQLLDSTQYQENDENPFLYGGDWEQFNIHYGDSFTFPDFKWQGGFKYIINLTQIGRCGESVSNWDTIEIQPGAKIIASPATVYSNPLGPSALQLNGFVGNATSFAWSPTSYLDKPLDLNPVATPTDTITYILSAFTNNCEAYDTLFIKLNTLAFAGVVDTVCNSAVLLGANFDASLFLAYQYVESPSDVWSQISSRLANDSAFFDKLSMYFLSQHGKSVLQSIPAYANFLGSLNRNQFYEKSWYLNYFMQYHNSHNYQDAFDKFDQEVRADNALKNYIGANSIFHLAALQTFLDLYENAVLNNNQVQLSTVWEKYIENGTQWESLGNWDNQIKIWDSVAVPTQYKITVIDNANSLVEFDQVAIWADRAIAPMYYVQFQTDSTIYFTNVSDPIAPTTIYNWNFADGTTSNQTNPVHTFPYFDSTYIVCLSASNLCGTYTYCDTIRVDSAGLIGYSMIGRGGGDEERKGDVVMGRYEGERMVEKSSNSYESGIKVIAYPNPFNHDLTISYQISNDYQQGELLVQNSLGQTMSQQKFHGPSGQLKIPVQTLSAGLYTYQMILDGRLVQTGKLARE